MRSQIIHLTSANLGCVLHQGPAQVRKAGADRGPGRAFVSTAVFSTTKCHVGVVVVGNNNNKLPCGSSPPPIYHHQMVWPAPGGTDPLSRGPEPSTAAPGLLFYFL